MIETCERPVKEEGLCEHHIPEWRRSDEFRASIMDDKVRGWFQLGLKERGMREVDKFRRKWAKRINNAEAS
jgi:hypothetical protein